MGNFKPATWPVIVCDHSAGGQIVFVHEIGCQLRGAINRAWKIVAAMLTHFDAYAVIVSWTVKIGVLTLFVGGKMLDGHIVLGGEVPSEKARAVAADTFGGTKRAASEG